MNGRYSVTLTLEPLTPLARIWYRRLGMTGPLSESRSPLATEVARLVPYERRNFHRRFANTMGYFWIPCPLCGREFGGHEGGGSVPNPLHDVDGKRRPGWLIICSQCTIERNRETP